MLGWVETRANDGCNEEAFGRGERIRTSGLYVPNVALYQAKLHPDGATRVVINGGHPTNLQHLVAAGWPARLTGSCHKPGQEDRSTD